MFLNRISELNLRYALGEVALIFIGVTAAFVSDQFKSRQQTFVQYLLAPNCTQRSAVIGPSKMLVWDW